MTSNYTKLIIKTQYLSMRKTQKRQEQLEIGKIKFEVTSLYTGNTFLTSIFQIKFTPTALSETTNASPKVMTLRILVLGALFHILMLYAHHQLTILGFIPHTNPILIKYIVPLLFTEFLTPYLPMLEQLLTTNNLLTV